MYKENQGNAARYDLKTVNIVLPGEESTDAVSAALRVINDMRQFYRGIEADMGAVEQVLQVVGVHILCFFSLSIRF